MSILTRIPQRVGNLVDHKFNGLEMFGERCGFGIHSIPVNPAGASTPSHSLNGMGLGNPPLLSLVSFFFRRSMGFKFVRGAVSDGVVETTRQNDKTLATIFFGVRESGSDISVCFNNGIIERFF